MKCVWSLGVAAALLCMSSDAWPQSQPRDWSGPVRLPPVNSEPEAASHHPRTNPDEARTAAQQSVQPASAILPESAAPSPDRTKFPLSASVPMESNPKAVEEVSNLSRLGSPPPSTLELTPGLGPEQTPGSAWETPDLDGTACLPQGFQPTWYARVFGLFLGRGDQPRGVWLSREAADDSHLLMHTQNDLGWRGGGEIRFGRHFDRIGCAVEGAYWTLAPLASLDSQTHTNLVSTPLDFTDLGWADPRIPGSPAGLFNAAEEHRLWRRDTVHNIELALVRDREEALSNGPYGFGWSAAVRYFRFAEGLRFGSLDQDGFRWGADPSMEGYLDDKIVNNLIGFQLGCRADCRWDRWRLYASPKAGIYDNYVRHRFSAYRGDGQLFAPVIDAYPEFPIRSTANTLAFLGEIDAGIEWQFALRWTATVGYRVLIAAGMGLADDQIPSRVADTAAIADIDADGHLLLYGGYAGMTYQF